MPAADATLALTDTPLLVAFVDQTQITNVALWPGLTSPALDNGWTRTHSCGVTCLEGFGLGFGLGELGFGVGLGLVVAEGDDVPAGDEDGGVELDVLALEVLGVDDGLAADDLLDDADELGEADLLAVPDVLDEADALAEVDALADLPDDRDGRADFIGDADELASAAADVLLLGPVTAAESTVLFGISGHAADLMIEWLLASAA
jgi:hypothetical protein